MLFSIWKIWFNNMSTVASGRIQVDLKSCKLRWPNSLSAKKLYLKLILLNFSLYPYSGNIY